MTALKSKLLDSAMAPPAPLPPLSTNGIQTMPPVIQAPTQPNTRPVKVMLALPSGRTWEARTATCVAGLAAHSITQGIQIGILNMEGSMITKQRNDLVEMARKQDADYMLFLDSVTPETPILVRRPGEQFVDFVEVCELMPPSMRMERRRTYATLNYEVLTHKGWQVPAAVMQAKVKKPVIRVTDESGTVCVTEDHSLFSDGAEIAGRDIAIGTKLDHSSIADVGLVENNLPPVTDDYAEVLGIFAAEGTCGVYEQDDGSSPLYQWNISNKDKELLERCQRTLQSVHCRAFKFTPDNGDMWRLRPNRPADLVRMYEPMFYTHTGKKRIPKFILNAPVRTVRAFLRGYEIGDGHVVASGLQSTTTNSMTLAAGLHFLYARMGRDFGLNGQRQDKPEIVQMYERAGGKDFLKKPPGVRHINRDADYDGWVYDLNTEAGTFVGGVGLFVLHNTDMVVPVDTLCRLLSHQKEVVGATYNKRVPPYETLGKLKGEKPSDDELRKGGLREAELLPTGILLIKMSVFDRVPWPWFFETYEWPGKDGVESLKEYIRHNFATFADEDALSELEGCEKLKKWLNATYVIETRGFQYFSEDLNFFRKLVKCKIQAYCDLDISFLSKHLGTLEVTCAPPPKPTVLTAAVM